MADLEVHLREAQAQVQDDVQAHHITSHIMHRLITTHTPLYQTLKPCSCIMWALVGASRGHQRGACWSGGVATRVQPRL